MTGSKEPYMVHYPSGKETDCKSVMIVFDSQMHLQEVIMEEICKFTINNRIYTIYDVDKIQGKENYVGRSRYNERDIYIEKGSLEQMLLTLKHELMHVWLYENGHPNQDGQEIFDYEDLCEYVALSNDSINRIVDEYLLQKGLK